MMLMIHKEVSRFKQLYRNILNPQSVSFLQMGTNPILSNKLRMVETHKRQNWTHFFKD